LSLRVMVGTTWPSSTMRHVALDHVFSDEPVPTLAAAQATLVARVRDVLDTYVIRRRDIPTAENAAAAATAVTRTGWMRDGSSKFNRMRDGKVAAARMSTDPQPQAWGDVVNYLCKAVRGAHADRHTVNVYHDAAACLFRVPIADRSDLVVVWGDNATHQYVTFYMHKCPLLASIYAVIVKKPCLVLLDVHGSTRSRCTSPRA
jgi:hypothetical protein